MLVWCPWSRKMDLFNILLQCGLITSIIVFYLIVFKKPQPKRGNYSNQGWNYPLKYLCALYAVKRWKGKRKATADEAPNPDLTGGWDNLCVKALGSDGTALMLGVRRLCDKSQLAEVTVYLQLPDGTRFTLPRHPDTAVGVWEPSPDGSWAAGGLKIQVLQPKLRLRILYDGDLTNVDRKITQHVRCSFIWSSGSYTHHHPEDWSIQLAAQALATEPWRDGNWPGILNRWNESSWLQWGCVQGRFESYDSRGTPELSVWIQARGYKERSWTPRGYQGLRRDVNMMVTGTDGTMVQLRAVSHRDVLTNVVAGCVRFPDYEVETISWTDFSLPDFGEYVGGVPDIYTINVATNKGRTVKLILRMSNEPNYLLSGVPYQYRVFYQTVTATVDEYQGTGLLELGYEPEEIRMPSVPLSGARRLRFRSMEEVVMDDVTYCLHLSSTAAECPALVGGKGASLALLSRVQYEEDYRVPPGFCVTTLALDKQLEMNPELKAAILEIEAAGGNYEEAVFKEKCNKTVELFTSSVVVPEVKEELLVHLRELRKEAIDEDLGPTVRFAVRSSGVGEDGECLSAAGQNDTILGCVTDDDVLNALLKCWASMYAFTSAYYRRQNGERCQCSGGVVVQTLVSARSAGVMFTSHPTQGGGHVLITANYGLGESVVSGTVEPDTIVVSESSDEPVISSLVVGDKSHLLQPEEGGGGLVKVTATTAARAVPCLSGPETLRLAAVARRQRALWAAHRDIEWAVAHDVIYLLQARPITSLERWSEEELLHEFDDPIMSDDTLTTFANTGEVMPKPMSPLTFDLVINPMVLNMYELIEFKKPLEELHVFKRGCGVTHYRVYLEPYNLYYRRVSSKVDLSVKMSDMAVHGHVSADMATLAVATHIHPPRTLNKIAMFKYLIKCLLTASWAEKSSAKQVTKTSIDTSSEEPETMLNNVEASFGDVMFFHKNHMITSSASSATQIISMSVLLEGGEDFSPAQCNEVGAMLGGCNTVSAEVGPATRRVARAMVADGGDLPGELPAKDKLVWLRRHRPHLYGDIVAFLDEHGHRALMEFDLATKPWSLEPEKFVEVLLSMDVTEDDTPPKVDLSHLIASLTTPKKSSTRKILSWILPMCRRMVVYRESTKASVILHIHKLRLALLEVGKQMVKKWMLPDRDLVFFFRLHELKNYLATRDPVLLRKAQLRRQYRPQWSRLRFPETSRGWPLPRPRPPPAPSPSSSSSSTASPSLVGTPVCAGDVVGRAAVITDLDEIGQLKQGDILITHSTDIGWSPYFPMLSGIVTELGGLISHGAVIAREYGLPCIVGAAGATDMFVTGDMVRLSGAAGTLQKVLAEADTDNTCEE